MKICPHCNSHIPEEEAKCPACGKIYWEPIQEKIQGEDKEIQEERKGCLSVLFVPFFLSIAVTVFLIFLGFLINLVSHFENNQIKIIWIGSSLIIGFFFYILFSKIRK